MLSKFRKIKMVIPAIAVAAALCLPVAAQQDLTFVTPDGRTVSLSSMRGKVTVLLFGGTQDPQCREEFRALEALAERYKGKNVGIYWVSVDPSDVPNTRLQNPCGPVGSVIVLRDPNRAAFKQFSSRVAQLPTIVVLSADSQIAGQPRGGFNPNSDFINDMAAVIDGLMKSK